MTPVTRGHIRNRLAFSHAAVRPPLNRRRPADTHRRLRTMKKPPINKTSLNTWNRGGGDYTPNLHVHAHTETTN